MTFFATPVSTFLPRYNGAFQVGARVRFYDAGTNTPKTMYQDGLLNTPFDPNNITSDANAQFPSIWGQGGAYKAVITAPGGQVIREMDNLPGDDAVVDGGGGGGGSTTQITGDIQPSFLSGTRTGFVRANARTIGAAASGATERADADCEALFLGLWPNTLFAVSGGRGASAAADWAANKTLTLPDGRLCALIGSDGMGNSNSNLFSALTFTSGNASTVGSKVGSATHALTTAQLASHTHGGATSTAPDHQHTGTTAGAGNHTHTGGTTSDGDHQHTYNVPNSAVNYEAGGGLAFGFSTTTDSTGIAGGHTHSVSLNTAPDHQHTITVNPGGGHTHTITTDAAGSGAAHPNVQNSLLVTYYIKL